MTSLRKSVRINSPLPKDLADPIAAKGIDNIIPQDILTNAKGLAIFTVVKAGFLFSGRAGSGIVVARLEDGSWSAPSAIGTGGMGFGGQIGAEITDFVIVLNTRAAVKSFSKGGNVTLGGNLSVAAGPIGRTAEAGASATIGSVAAIYSYSKTKGLFAGISIEGSIIVERKDANEAFYRSPVSAEDLLSGAVPPPPQADILYRALNTKATGSYHRAATATIGDDTGYQSAGINRSASAAQPGRYGGSSQVAPSYNPTSGGGSTSPYRARSVMSPGTYGNNHAPTSNNEKSAGLGAIRDEEEEPAPRYTPSAAPVDYKATTNSYGRPSTDNNNPFNAGQHHMNQNIANSGAKPRAPPPPPVGAKPEVVVALYDYTGDQATDLSFRKGDRITVVKKTQSRNDWWTGRCNGQEGSFPANYTQ
ncbi:hypothetical protein BGX31_001645 [Mortierella sp. GBA43]|nr:hypothetical protein BGX31_001645 [Mortierella sp. GBA43]